MELTLLPLGLPGNIYRSPMPFGQYDRTGLVYQAFAENEIRVVVLLVPDAECWVYAGQDLRTTLRTRRVDRDPPADERLPGTTIPAISAAVDETLRLASLGNNIDIHCHAGLGRTGLFAACLATRQLGMSGDSAIQWIRGLVPGSVESDEQERVIREFSLSDITHLMRTWN
jgi:protein-tyrosine phosphatase